MPPGKGYSKAEMKQMKKRGKRKGKLRPQPKQRKVVGGRKVKS